MPQTMSRMTWAVASCIKAVYAAACAWLLIADLVGRRLVDATQHCRCLGTGGGRTLGLSSGPLPSMGSAAACPPQEHP
jgi:hypothetical protein